MAKWNLDGKIEGKFYPLQMEELLKLKKLKLINNVAFAYFALKYENPWGDHPVTIIIKEFALRWSMAEASVYKALAKLKELEIIKIQSGKVTLEWIPESTGDYQNREILETDTDKELPKLSEPINSQDYQNGKKIIRSDNSLSNPIIDYQIRENKSPEPLPDKDSSSLQTIKTFQTPQTGEGEEKINQQKPNQEKVERNNQKTINQQEQEVELTKLEVELLQIEPTKQEVELEEVKPTELEVKEVELTKKVREKDSTDKHLIEQIKEQLLSLEIPLDQVVRKCIEKHHISQVQKAIAHIENTWEDIRNPRSVFLYQVPKQTVEKPLKNPLTPEFLDWYSEAITQGQVIDRPAKTLPLNHFREPLVILPDGRQMDWEQVRDGNVQPLLSPSESGEFWAKIRAQLASKKIEH